MNSKELKKQISSILEKIEDVRVLKDILNIINAIYIHFQSGKWGR